MVLLMACMGSVITKMSLDETGAASTMRADSIHLQPDN